MPRNAQFHCYEYGLKSWHCIVNSGPPRLRRSFSVEDDGGAAAPQSRAFTLIELLLVLSVIAILSAILLPAISTAKTRAQVIGCLNNTRQLTLAWHLYSTDYNDHVANNYGASETISAITTKKLDTWANNVMSWGASETVQDVSNTNIDWIANGVLGRYSAGAIGVYKCPADKVLSPSQLRAGFWQRNRSLSMNSLFGLFSSAPDSVQNGVNRGFPEYRQYLTQAQVPKPAKTWLFIDEHPDSINDGYMVENPNLNHWQDIPASYHNGACDFAFADGHSEPRKWLSAASRYNGVLFSYERARMDFDAAGRADFAWYLERTGYVDARTGLPAFNY